MDAPNFAIVHESLADDEFQQMSPDVRADDAVRFDHGARLGIDLVPGAADLRLQPAAQRTEQVGEPFAPGMARFDRFTAGRILERWPGAGTCSRPTAAVARPLDDDFVHVRSHIKRGGCLEFQVE